MARQLESQSAPGAQQVGHRHGLLGFHDQRAGHPRYQRAGAVRVRHQAERADGGGQAPGAHQGAGDAESPRGSGEGGAGHPKPALLHADHLQRCQAAAAIEAAARPGEPQRQHGPHRSELQQARPAQDDAAAAILEHPQPLAIVVAIGYQQTPALALGNSVEGAGDTTQLLPQPVKL